ncbi:MAG: 3-dehydroquinate synthase [Chlamydiia bacterium]|nr:3-dehydroquinate synthase [Chlamydiia bacterium]
MIAPVQIGEKLLASEELINFCLQSGLRVALISDRRVASLLGDKFLRHLQNRSVDVELFTFAEGELSKTRETKMRLEDEMLAKGFRKETLILALGGGVTLDLAGFLAANFCRGVPWVSLPTSLLAMVDGCIGGKTGVNTPLGKNLVGALYHPQMVLIDTTTLRTLPLKEVRNGIVEMVKHGVIADAAYFSLIESKLEKVQALHIDIAHEAIEGSCRIKQKLCREEISHRGKRSLLAFGHTIGHAIEKVSHYSVPHGEAIALGMIAEAYISYRQGKLDFTSFERIERVLRENHPGLALEPNISSKKLWEAIGADRKEPQFVMLSKIGAPLECEGKWRMQVKEKLLAHALDWLCDALHCYP